MRWSGGPACLTFATAEALGVTGVVRASGAAVLDGSVGPAVRDESSVPEQAASAKLSPPSLRVHDLRHTAASFAISSGATVKAVQRQLGHRSAMVTLDRYAHLWPDELDALGEGLERLRATAPADSLRTLDADASVLPLASRR